MEKAVQAVDGKGYKTNTDVLITIASRMEMVAVVPAVLLGGKF